jgi:hypothetical protein
MSELKFATRLNSFASGAHLYWKDLKGKPTVMQMIERAATAKGLTHLDLNYPQHITTDDIKAMRQKIEEVGLAVNGMQMTLGCSRIQDRRIHQSRPCYSS